MKLLIALLVLVLWPPRPSVAAEKQAGAGKLAKAAQVKKISQVPAVLRLLNQWWPVLEAHAGRHLLQRPPDPASQTGADDLLPLLRQWNQALDGLAGSHRLHAPPAGPGVKTSALRTLLDQWWPALEQMLGRHALEKPAFS